MVQIGPGTAMQQGYGGPVGQVGHPADGAESAVSGRCQGPMVIEVLSTHVMQQSIRGPVAKSTPIAAELMSLWEAGAEGGKGAGRGWASGVGLQSPWSSLGCGMIRRHERMTT